MSRHATLLVRNAHRKERCVTRHRTAARETRDSLGITFRFLKFSATNLVPRVFATFKMTVRETKKCDLIFFGTLFEGSNKAVYHIL